MEREALYEAVLTVALSSSDSAYLAEHVASSQTTELLPGHQPACSIRSKNAVPPVIQVLLCALREDMRQLPLSLPSPLPREEQLTSKLEWHPAAADEYLRARPYLTCCVRLSPEKEPHRFVELVEELARRGVFGLQGVTTDETDGAGAARSGRQPGLVPLMVGSAKDEYAQVRPRCVRGHCTATLGRKEGYYMLRPLRCNPT